MNKEERMGRLFKFPSVKETMASAKQEELTPEQIEQLKQFAELPPEEKEKLIEQQCIFCQIAKGNVETIKVYEDSSLLAVLDINPANPGHILLFPKQHFQFLFQLPVKVGNKLFELASKLSTYLVNAVKAGGINLYAAGGAAAGQRIPHFVLHVIPRFEGDGISFEWQTKKADQKELKKIAAALKKDLKTGVEVKGEEKEHKKKVEKELARQLKKLRRRA